MRLYGKNPVLERIKFNPDSIRKIYIRTGHEEASYIRKKVQKRGIPIYLVPATKIQKMARHVNTQGLLAEVDAFPYADFGDLLALTLKKNHVLIFLDKLNDPQNLGAMIRSLACFGRFSVVLPRHHSVAVTEAVLRIACGGENYVGISQVSNLGQAIDRAREQGVSVAGAVVSRGEDLRRVRFSFPLGLVIGSEQKGIREVIRRKLDQAVTLPMSQPRLSLNAAQATTVFCYEIFRQREAADAA